MEKRTWGPFTGTHLTILLTAAILAIIPTALWSVDAFNNVAIQDPISGKKVAVDVARRMFVYDQVGDWDETPANFVTIFFNGASGCTPIYTVPAGKALILKGMNVYLFKVNTGSVDLQTILFGAASCTGGVIAAALSAQVQESKAVEFGAGIAIPAGHVLSQSSLNNAGTGNLYGYLVPAGWVPASAPTSASAAPKEGNPLLAAARR
jgi:hypothetical protein